MTNSSEVPAAKDEGLVRAAQAGDSEAFAALLDAHLPHVRTFIALKAPVAQLVDEVAHDAFVFAYRHLAEFQAGTSFRAWVRAIAWNLLRAEVQRYAREQQNLDRLAAWHVEAALADGDVGETSAGAEHLEHCLGELTGPLRELITLRYQEDCSTGEISVRLRRSLVWVRVSLFRVRAQLRDCIERKLGERKPC